MHYLRLIVKNVCIRVHLKGAFFCGSTIVPLTSEIGFLISDRSKNIIELSVVLTVSRY